MYHIDTVHSEYKKSIQHISKLYLIPFTLDVRQRVFDHICGKIFGRQYHNFRRVLLTLSPSIQQFYPLALDLPLGDGLGHVLPEGCAGGDVKAQDGVLGRHKVGAQVSPVYTDEKTENDLAA